MLVALFSLLAGVSHSLTFSKTSTEVHPIYCTKSGWSFTTNSSAYSSMDIVDDAAWVWAANNATNYDYCSVNVTFEYRAGSSVNITFKSADNSYIYLNSALIYNGYSIISQSITNKFNETGVYHFEIVSQHSVGSFGFSFKFTENYECPSSCVECGSPLTCLSCVENANLLNDTCQCPENSLQTENACECSEGFEVNNENSLFSCVENTEESDESENDESESDESENDEDNEGDVIINNDIDIGDNADNIDIDISINLRSKKEGKDSHENRREVGNDSHENREKNRNDDESDVVVENSIDIGDEASDIEIGINIDLKQEVPVTFELLAESEEDANGISFASIFVVGLACILALLIVAKIVSKKKTFVSASEGETSYQLISH